jgi:hypothetical protein
VGHGTDAVREIPTDEETEGAGLAGERGDVEELTARAGRTTSWTSGAAKAARRSSRRSTRPSRDGTRRRCVAGLRPRRRRWDWSA